MGSIWPRMSVLLMPISDIMGKQCQINNCMINFQYKTIKSMVKIVVFKK